MFACVQWSPTFVKSSEICIFFACYSYKCTPLQRRRGCIMSKFCVYRHFPHCCHVTYELGTLKTGSASHGESGTSDPSPRKFMANPACNAPVRISARVMPTQIRRGTAPKIFVERRPRIRTNDPWTLSHTNCSGGSDGVRRTHARTRGNRGARRWAKEACIPSHVWVA